MPSGGNKPFWATSVFDTSADTYEDGFVTPSERYQPENNYFSGAMDFANELTWRRNWDKEMRRRLMSLGEVSIEFDDDGSD